MSGRKLVSVVTGTYNRHDLLLECIENVREQTYRPLEHVIVSDGPDPELYDLLARRREDRESCPHEVYGDVPLRFAELGFWSSGLFTNSISAAPFMVAQLLARGEYIVWMADDERWRDPDAIEQMVKTLEAYDADWVYSKVLLTWPDSDHELVIGCTPPKNGQFTNCLHRRDMLDRGMLFRTHVGSGTDWDCAARAMASGSRWVFVPDVLLSHIVHK